MKGDFVAGIDIFAECSIDYNKNAEVTQQFYFHHRNIIHIKNKIPNITNTNFVLFSPPIPHPPAATQRFSTHFSPTISHLHALSTPISPI